MKFSSTLRRGLVGFYFCIASVAFALKSADSYVINANFDKNNFDRAINANFDQHRTPYPPPHPPPYPPHMDSIEKLKQLPGAANTKTKPPPLPMTNNPYAILGFDWFNPPLDFALIQKAYKQMVKQYHPDRIVGPDSTPEKRHQANMDFARINAAYERLKAKQLEETLEYIVYVDGKKVKRHVTIKSESYYKDPTRPNYDRIIAMSEYRKKNPRRKMWYDKMHDYKPRHNGDWAPKSPFSTVL